MSGPVLHHPAPGGRLGWCACCGIDLGECCDLGKALCCLCLAGDCAVCYGGPDEPEVPPTETVTVREGLL